MPKRPQCQLEGCTAPARPRSKHCSEAHRKSDKRARDKQRATAAVARRGKTIPEDKLQKVTEKVIAEEIRPTIQESLSADVLKALEDLVKLTPEVVAAIAKDLRSDNEFLRQHAYQTLLKYTVGQNALIPSIDKDNQPMTVIIEGLARPEPEEIRSPLQKTGSDAEIEAGMQDSADSAAEYRICDSCRTPKPLDEFMGNSNRCVTCFDRIRTSAAVAVGDES